LQSDSDGNPEHYKDEGNKQRYECNPASRRSVERLLPNACKIDSGRPLPIPRRAESMIERYESRRK
jgi:YD repeat-containing protein